MRFDEEASRFLSSSTGFGRKQDEEAMSCGGSPSDGSAR